jgi:hypothetical protein
VKASEWKRFVAPIVGPGWQFSGQLAYRVPVGWVLHGLLAERSSGPGFYLWKVRMPLYVPDTGLVLSYGSDRVGGGSHLWDVGPAAAQAVARTAVAVASDAQAARLIAPEPDYDEGFRTHETWAYGLVLEGEVDKAIDILGGVCSAETTYAWEREVVDRAAGVRAALVSGRVDEVRDQLAEWRSATATAIGVQLP